MAVGSKSGIVTKVLGVLGVVTSVWRCQESVECIGDNWKVAGKWGILLHYSTRTTPSGNSRGALKTHQVS